MKDRGKLRVIRTDGIHITRAAAPHRGELTRERQMLWMPGRTVEVDDQPMVADGPDVVAGAPPDGARGRRIKAEGRRDPVRTVKLADAASSRECERRRADPHAIAAHDRAGFDVDAGDIARACHRAIAGSHRASDVRRGGRGRTAGHEAGEEHRRNARHVDSSYGCSRFATTSAMSYTGTVASFALTPSLIIVMQKGQAVAIASAPVASSSCVRSMLIRLPCVSSIHMRPPPAPQHMPRLLLRSGSTRFMTGSARASVCLGAS